MASLYSDQTLGQAYYEARRTLRDALQNQPLTTPDLDARLLVAAACAVPCHAPLLDGGQALLCTQIEQINRYIARRLEGEPVAHILGEKAFWGLDFIVTEHTLVPRPETEGIVEEVLKWVKARDRCDDDLRIVDIGTGSGAILISLLSELPHGVGFAVDISKQALDVALQNARRHNVATRFQPVLSSYGAALAGRFDVIVTNPPYIGFNERDALAVEVRDYDPSLALFSGDDGLDAFRQIMPWCGKHLADDGFCIMEHGSTQSEPLIALARKNGFERSECVFDMAKLPRFVKITRN